MSGKTDRVLITGIGAVTPFGDSLREYFDGLAGKQDLYKEITVFDRRVVPPVSGVAVGTEGDCGSRILAMGVRALRLALDDWGADAKRKKRAVFVLGSGVGSADRALFPDCPDCGAQCNDRPLASEIAKQAGFDCRSVFVSSACSSSSEAIAYAGDLLRQGRYDLAVAGGAEALSQLVFAGFLKLHSVDEAGCRPFDKNRKGIMSGEGSALFVMERESDCVGKKRYAALLGSGITNDAYHTVSMNREGTQIVRAMELTLRDGGVDKEEIDLVVAHATGTVINDETESACIRRLFGEKNDRIRVTAPKGTIGHTGGASGAFGVLTAVAALWYQTVPPIMRLVEPDEKCRLPLARGFAEHRTIKYAIVNSFAFGGVNTALLIGEA